MNQRCQTPEVTVSTVQLRYHEHRVMLRIINDSSLTADSLELGHVILSLNLALTVFSVSVG